MFIDVLENGAIYGVILSIIIENIIIDKEINMGITTFSGFVFWFGVRATKYANITSIPLM